MNSSPKRLIAGFLIGMTALVSGCGGTVGKSGVASGKRGPVRVAMIPKFTSDPYFKAAEQGGRAAAAELHVSFSFNGPVDADVSKQSELVDRYVQQHYDAITVSANDANAIAPALRRAQAAGVKVSTFDADAAVNSRQVFLNQATFAGMGQTMVDMMAEQTGGRGNFLIVTAVLTAPNQNRWIAEMRKYIAAKYPKMKIKAVLPGNEDLAKSRQVTLDYLRAHREINGVWAVTGIATPGVAQAVKELGLKGKVAITGLGVPSLVRPFIKDGTIKQVCLWNPTDIGYAAVYMAKAQIDGTLKPGTGNRLAAGRLGDLQFIAPDTILLGKPLIFNAKNIDSFHF